MTGRRVVSAVGALAALGVGACDHPAGVRIERFEVSGTVTSTVDGAAVAGVGVMVAHDVVGFFGGGIGSCPGGETTVTGVDGAYAVRCYLEGGFDCGSSSYWIAVSPPDGWVPDFAASDNGGYLRCSEEPQVVNIRLAPTVE